MNGIPREQGDSGAFRSPGVSEFRGVERISKKETARENDLSSKVTQHKPLNTQTNQEHIRVQGVCDNIRVMKLIGCRDINVNLG